MISVEVLTVLIDDDGRHPIVEFKRAASELLAESTYWKRVATAREAMSPTEVCAVIAELVRLREVEARDPEWDHAQLLLELDACKRDRSALQNTRDELLNHQNLLLNEKRELQRQLAASKVDKLHALPLETSFCVGSGGTGIATGLECTGSWLKSDNPIGSGNGGAGVAHG